MKLKFMSREMRVFISFVVWLFSFAGADGKLTIRPDNVVLVKGSTATLQCASDRGSPRWTFRTFANFDELDWPIVGWDCSTDSNYDDSPPFVDANRPSESQCDLIVKEAVNQTTYMYSCEENDSLEREREVARVILIILESPLKCGIEDNQFTCTMTNSVYRNDSEIYSNYLSILLTLKDEHGSIVGSQYADFQNTPTVVKVPIPYGATKDSPYVCSAEFKMEGSLEAIYSPIIKIVPGGKLECKFPETAEQEQEAQEASASATAVTKEAAAAAAAAAAGNGTSKASE